MGFSEKAGYAAGIGCVIAPILGLGIGIAALFGGCDSKPEQPQSRPATVVSAPSTSTERAQRDLEEQGYSSREDMLTELNPYIGQTGTEGNPYYPEFSGGSTSRNYSRTPIEGGETSRPHSADSTPPPEPTNLEQFLRNATWDTLEVRTHPEDGQDYTILPVQGGTPYWIQQSAMGELEGHLDDLQRYTLGEFGHGIKNASDLRSILDRIGRDHRITAQEISAYNDPEQMGALQGFTHRLYH